MNFCDDSVFSQLADWK